MILRRNAVIGYLILLAILSAHIFTTSNAHALNGPQFIGFSAESTALVGSGHVAVADTSSINTNPAAMSLIEGTRFDVTAGFIQAFLHHSDVFGNNNVAGENNVYAIGNLGAATRLASVPGLTIGAGIFTQGGFGSDYENLRTAFGTRDDASSFFRYLKFAIGLSYEATDKLSFGIAPSVGYSDVSLRLFPGTSVFPSPGLPNGFAGFNIRDSCARNGGLGPLGGDCPYDVVFSVKFGAMYRALPWLTIGATYTSPVSFNHTGGQATLNFSSFGLGLVNYDARVTGIKWPQQVDVSMAAKPTEQFTVTMTTSWLNWSTINNIDITATNPSNPLAPSQVTLTIPFNWKDQVVIALGFSYSVMQESSWKNKDRLVLRAGYNYSNNPIPKETLSPLWPLINEHHFAAGVGFRFTERWSYDFTGLYAPKNSVTYTNPSLPFGPNATESISGYQISNTVSYRF
ncbi:MAG TPA: outer membrane protein transport protein [Nitrospira sp.]|nr:outer membrane protein transport protein [Nitrospira sp.]